MSAPIVSDPSPPMPCCPGCGGRWREQPAGGREACERCGLERADAAQLLWSAAADVYAAARSAALEGRFAEARRLISSLRGDAASDGALRRLDRLCAAALGETEEAYPAALADYAAARDAAVRGDVTEAVLLARRSAAAAPAVLGVQKLLLLLLAATGEEESTERRRADLERLLPGDPDLSRWRFSDREAPASPPGRLARIPRRHRRPRRAAVPTAPILPPPPRRRSFRILSALSLAVSGAALALAAFALVRVASTPAGGAPRPLAAPPVFLTPTPTVSPAASGTTGAASASIEKIHGIASGLVREAEDRRRAADFAQARAWFNRAVQAKRAGDWDACDRLAAGAYALGADSYLGDESLLLRAQAAENRGDGLGAAARYAAIAEEKPTSAYAAWALARAAGLARREGRMDIARRYRDERERRYPAAPGSASTKENRTSGANPTRESGVGLQADG